MCNLIKLPDNKDKIGYLVRQRFPDAPVLRTPPASRRPLQAPPDPERVKSLLVYENELSTISDDELDTLFNETMRNNQAEAKGKRELEEKARFFNRANAEADLDHWSKTAYWTLDEAVALTFGKKPRVVN